MAQFAYEDAAAHFERGLAAAERGETEEARRCELLLALGEARGRAGESASAREAFGRAAELARRLGDPELLARAAFDYGMSFAWDEMGRVDRFTVELLEEALEALGTRDSRDRALLLARLAGDLFWSAEDAQRRASLSREALEVARRVGDPAVLAYAPSCATRRST